MKRAWHPDELAHHWTLAPEERKLVGNNTTGAARLSSAVLLKSFQFNGRFPERRWDVAGSVVVHLANQIGVPPEAYFDGEWSGRTLRRQRVRIREYCGFRPFRSRDESGLVAWLSPRVTSLNPEAEALKLAAYDYLRSRRIESPAPDRLLRLLSVATRQCEERLVRQIAVQLSPETRAELDALVKTQASENDADVDQMPLFPVRSDLALIKEGAGAVKVETVLDEVAKLKQLRALGLPEALFKDAPAKLVTHYRQRAASEKPRELRRHPAQMRSFLLAALCWQREREITDDLVELLIHIAHHVGVRAEEKVNTELMKYVKKVMGKAKLLYKLAKAATGQPDGGAIKGASRFTLPRRGPRASNRPNLR